MYYYKNTKKFKNIKKDRKRRLAKSHWFFGQNVKTRSKRCEAKNCVSSNVNVCLPDSVESIVQGIKILQKATGGSKVNPYSFFIKNNKDTHTP